MTTTNSALNNPLLIVILGLFVLFASVFSGADVISF